jgi:hypothetical protein
LKLGAFGLLVRNQREGLERGARRVLVSLRLQLAEIPGREDGRFDGGYARIVVAHVLADVVHVTDRDGELPDAHPLGDAHGRADGATQPLDGMLLPLANADQQHALDAGRRITGIEDQRLVLAAGEVTALQDARDGAAVQLIHLGDEADRFAVALEDVQHEQRRLQLGDGNEHRRDRGLRHGFAAQRATCCARSPGRSATSTPASRLPSAARDRR